MKIAILAPPYLPIPPNGYGGVERVVYLLTEGLVKKGHDVTLFAPGDSKVSAKLFSTFPKSIGNSGELKNKPFYPLLQYVDCFKRASEFDIIHNHAEHLAMFLAELVTTPVVHTIHSTLIDGETLPEKRLVWERFKKHHFVSISDNQREGMKDLNYAGTVYNGIDISGYKYIENPRGDYLLWVGRITPKKGPLEAIVASGKAGMKLVMAATIDPIEQKYYEEVIRPKIDGDKVEFVGELHGDSLSTLYGNAYATLVPISWHEPFGLVMVESMACGTPVVAYDIGSAREVVRDGHTGFVVKDQLEMVEAVERVRTLKRFDCLKRVEEKFTAERMVSGYEAVYRKILNK